ncbi:MAG: hypothetical protein N3E47_04770 [Candidatus Bathyarchaeota archaeon]|nr:hypothetical protein [Candidatus Bathyarchaeota archaeon]
MRILLINLCYEPLSELEFVRPIANILSNIGVNLLTKRYTEVNLRDLHSVEKVIISGSALRDDKFLVGEWFEWLEKCDRPVLGVGSSFQVIAKAFHCHLFDKAKIGLFNVKVVRENILVKEKEFYAYFLTGKAAKISKPLESLAKTGTLDCMIKHESKDVYGCLFHPEVTKPEIIVNFVLKT